MPVPALTANSPSAGSIAWAAFTIQFAGVSYPMSAGNTSQRCVWWIKGASTLSTGAAFPSTLTDEDLALFVNRNGAPVSVQSANVVDGSLVVTESIVGNAIAANSVNADRLIADSITAREIKADAITVSELGVSGLGTGIPINGEMEDVDAANVPAGWTRNYETATTGVTIGREVPGLSGTGSMRLTCGATTTSGEAVASRSFPVRPGEKLVVSAAVQAGTTRGPVYLRVLFGTVKDFARNAVVAAGPGIDNASIVGTDGSTPAFNTFGAGGYGDIVQAWTPPSSSVAYVISGQITVPAGATWMRVAVYQWSGVANATSYWDAVEVTPLIISTYIGDGIVATRMIGADQITATHIKTDAVEAKHIKGGTITADEIGSDAIYAYHIKAGEVKAGNIDALAINANHINGRIITARTMVVDGSIDAEQLSTNSIIARHIKAREIKADAIDVGAITTDKVQANAITTSKLTVANLGDNLLLNGQMDDWPSTDGYTYYTNGLGNRWGGKYIPDGWVDYDSTPAQADYGRLDQQSTVGKYSAYIYVNGGANHGSLASYRVPVKPGTSYLFGVKAASDIATPNFAWRVLWYNQQGAYLSYSELIGFKSQINQTFTLYETALAAPAGAAQAQVVVYNYQPSTGCHVMIDDIYMRERAGASLIVDGSIQAQHVAAGAITAGKISAGAISTDKLTVSAMSPNMVPNGSFEENLLGWQVGETLNGGGGSTVYTEASSDYWGGGGSTSAVLYNAGPGVGIAIESGWFPVEAGSSLYATMRAAAESAGGAALGWRIAWAQQAAKPTYLGHAGDITEIIPFNTTHFARPMSRLEGRVTVPANRKWAKVMIYAWDRPGPYYLIIDDVFVGRATMGVQIVDGAITADKISAGAITADKLTADAINGKTITGVSLRTAASGARVEMGTAFSGQGVIRWYAGNSPNYAASLGTVDNGGTSRSFVISGPFDGLSFSQIRMQTGGAITFASYETSTGAGGDILQVITQNSGRRDVFINPPAGLHFGTSTRQMINLWDVNYGIGIQGNTQYFRTGDRFSWFRNGSHSDTANDPGSGGSVLMRLENNGQLYTTTGNVMASSRRWKTDIVDMGPSLDTVDRLRPVTYRRTDLDEDLVRTGFIAEEIAEIDGLEDLLGYDVDGTTVAGLDYAGFVPLLVKAVQELRAEVELLKAA